MRNESEDKFGLFEVGSNSLRTITAPLTDLNIFLKDLSKSISVGTRKMVNYG